MKKNILSSPLIYPTILIFLCLFIAFKNYTPGTFLSGWDTLHPEFNFSLNFQKLIFGVWRTDQGLGDMSGHSHMADLPRVIILWLFHYIFPLSFLRYSYVFLCLILGSLGFYFLINQLFKKKQLSFLCALVYLFNLGTLQQFYVPFEMFPTQWAFLPWIFIFTISYLNSHHPKHLFLFLLTTLLGTPQAYAAHLWYPFFGLFCLFLLLYSIFKKIKPSIPLTLVVTTLLINSFWLLPNIYYAITNSNVVKENKINRLHSQEFLLKNRQTGVIRDSSLIRGFYFNWDIYNFPKKSSENLMPQWNNHLKNLDVLIIGNLLFLGAFVGFIAALIKKDFLFVALSPFFIIPFVLLTNRTPVFDLFFNLLLKNGLIAEILRFVFTKFSIIFTFSLSLFFSYFLNLLFNVFNIGNFKRYFSVIFILSLLIYNYPMFEGYLISPQIRLKIPDNYFQLWQYLNTSPRGKVLTLPLNEPSGWQYYDWGYQGSGLIWFGTNQSFFDRDSDRWSSYNEESYREFYYPLYANNPSQFSQSLKKYGVNYLLWDQSLITTSPKNRDQITFKYETERLIDRLTQENILSPIKEFGSIKLFQVNYSSPLIGLENINRFIGKSYPKNFFDSQFNNQNYITTNTSKDIIYPFRSILTNTDRIDSKLISLSTTESESILQIGQIPPLNITVYNIDTNNTILASFNTTETYNYELNSLPHQQGYLFGVQSRYYQGIPLRFCLKNSYSGLCTFEDELSKHTDFNWDYFLIPPMDSFDTYYIHLSAISYGNQLTKSELSNIKIIPLPFSELNNYSLNPISDQQNITNNITYKPIFPNNSLITATLPNVSNRQNLYLTLYQSYSPGWLAFYFDKNKIKFLNNHVLVNNWANGWEIKDINNNIIYILFWPQLLEFLGFALIPISFFWFIRLRSKIKVH